MTATPDESDPLAEHRAVAATDEAMAEYKATLAYYRTRAATLNAEVRARDAEVTELRTQVAGLTARLDDMLGAPETTDDTPGG